MNNFYRKKTQKDLKDLNLTNSKFNNMEKIQILKNTIIDQNKNNLKNKKIYGENFIKKLELLNRPKFICVGQPKTGTKSLKDLFYQFGYNVCSNPIIYNNENFNDEILLDNNIKIDKNKFFNNIDYLLENLYNFDFFHDIPYSYNYEKINQVFPNSKFILTLRDENEWFESLLKYQTIENAVSPTILKIVYNYEVISEDLKEKFINKFNEYNESVIKYFSDKPNKLLIINLCSKNKNEEEIVFNLLKFLNKDNQNELLNEIKFPHLNKQNY